MKFVLPWFYDITNLHKKFGINLTMFNLITFYMPN
jgi:hypothetical protein